jgi:hypothetical protein
MSWRVLLGLAVAIQAGCRKESAVNQNRPVDSANTAVQAELDHAAGSAFEHDPAKRPLILSQPAPNRRQWAHQTTNSAYWQRPQVWRDVQSSYEKFFALNPDAVGWRHDYAKDAYDCGQPAIFLQQAKLFSFGTNHAYFGGKEKFEEMLERATKAAISR